jgi:hypothetical protein
VLTAEGMKLLANFLQGPVGGNADAGAPLAREAG